MRASDRAPASRNEDLHWFEATVLGAGWDPAKPSEEFRDALKALDQTKLAPEKDRFGLSVGVLGLKLMRRFLRGKHPSGGHFNVLWKWSIYLVAEAELGGRRKITVGELKVKVRELETWYEQRYKPSLDRLHAASSEEIDLNPRAFQPALAQAVLNYDPNLFSPESHRKAIARGLEMHSEGRRWAQPRLKMDEDQLESVFHWLSDANPVAFIDDDGTIRIDELSVKTAADKLIGRSATTQEERCPTSLEAIAEGGGEDALDVLDTHSMDAFAALDAQDSAQRAQELIQKELDGVEPGSTKEFVLREYRSCVEGNSPWEGLTTRVAEACGRAPSTVSAAQASLGGTLGKAILNLTKKI